MCASPRQLVTELAGPPVSSWERNVLVLRPRSQDCCHNARCCRPQLPVPGWVPVRFDVHLFLQRERWWWMPYADHRCASLRHCATHDSVRQRPQSLGKLSTSRLNECAKAWDLLRCGSAEARIGARTCSLLVMQVSFLFFSVFFFFFGEWICRILSWQRKVIGFLCESLHKTYRREWWSSLVSITCVVLPSVAASLQKQEKYRISAG